MTLGAVAVLFALTRRLDRVPGGRAAALARSWPRAPGTPSSCSRRCWARSRRRSRWSSRRRILTFSIASSQLGPRLIRRFMRRPGHPGDARGVPRHAHVPGADPGVGALRLGPTGCPPCSVAAAVRAVAGLLRPASCSTCTASPRRSRRRASSPRSSPTSGRCWTSGDDYLPVGAPVAPTLTTVDVAVAAVHTRTAPARRGRSGLRRTARPPAPARSSRPSRCGDRARAPARPVRHRRARRSRGVLPGLCARRGAVRGRRSGRDRPVADAAPGPGVRDRPRWSRSRCGRCRRRSTTPTRV